MRAFALPALMVLLASGPAVAQDWIEYSNPTFGFSINFPHEPKSERIEYKNFYGKTVSARVFSAERGTGRYVMTVVNFSAEPTDSLTAVSHAAEAVRAKGTVTYSAFHHLDGIPGQVISVTQADGRLVQAGIYFLDQRLYIAEGSVGKGSPAPSHFQQSIIITDSEGEKVDLSDNFRPPRALGGAAPTAAPAP